MIFASGIRYVAKQIGYISKKNQIIIFKTHKKNPLKCKMKLKKWDWNNKVIVCLSLKKGR